MCPKCLCQVFLFQVSTFAAVKVYSGNALLEFRARYILYMLLAIFVPCAIGFPFLLEGLSDYYSQYSDSYMYFIILKRSNYCCSLRYIVHSPDVEYSI